MASDCVHHVVVFIMWLCSSCGCVGFVLCVEWKQWWGLVVLHLEVGV